jgi:hypothetical protein
VSVNVNSIRQATCRSMKTRKTIGKKTINTMKRIGSSKTLKLIETIDNV